MLLRTVLLVAATLVVMVHGKFRVTPYPTESCKHFVPDPEFNKEIAASMAASCMKRPKVAAALSSYDGPEEDRYAEILLTCFAAKSHLIISTGLMVDYFMESVRLGVQGTRMESSVVAALSVCEPTLLQGKLIVPFMRCIQEKCVEE
ncbi:uncharacterized protein LOC108679830 [Hyalella azteca]|uniref:Uncharacterized protein LOC108679830 n=1 Tax=Hyalella azteca TaxID=294128 RepID=A0A8B7PEL5_HYAAZ|nr:uncharacterized protein LOC108679830 [Hyalella azteca]